jgi:hypothetical protein
VNRLRIAAASGLLLAIAVPRADAQPQRSPASTGLETTKPVVRTVTLVTGDTVRVTGDVPGHQQVAVVPAPRADGDRPSFWVSQRSGDLTVMPQDVSALVPARLDPQLFDVTSLLAQGYGDASAKGIPLIVTYRGAHPGATRATLPGTTTERALPIVDGEAVRADKKNAAHLGNALDALATTGLRPSAGASGIDKIWLDERVHVRTDPDDAQIGAPAAWARHASRPRRTRRRSPEFHPDRRRDGSLRTRHARRVDHRRDRCCVRR